MADRTPLWDVQRPQAKFTEFGGWELPLQFQGIVAEHQAVRSNCGVFDVSHMGNLYVRGEGALAYLENLVPSALADLPENSGRYTVLLNEAGGILDDLIVYRLPDRTWLLIVNAATRAQDVAWLQQHLPPQVDLEDATTAHVLLAVQGPKAIAAVQTLTAGCLASLPRFGCGEYTMAGSTAWAARTGYTGEDGLEILVSADHGPHLWSELLAAGVTPCGLGSRDTLRLEAGLPLYGQDLDETTSPLAGGLGWLVHWERKGEFVGRAALEAERQQGIARKRVALRGEGKTIARPHYPIQVNGETVGEITSGTLSPTLSLPIAFGYVPPAYANVGQTLTVPVRDRLGVFTVIRGPFVAANTR
ncbi:MAG: glycine cleavage system aminomethyltransferase GcvT [Oscillatoriales cyanobacterium SM2_1_8]|nr:glycine cleavage system aminomethyltransferase GcvT [Oscillatoriales cyanobacterium SM2_1_8]